MAGIDDSRTLDALEMLKAEAMFTTMQEEDGDSASSK